MDDNLAIFLVLAVAVAGAVALIVLTRWIKADANGAALAGQDHQLRLATSENELLRGEIAGLQERLARLDRNEPALSGRTEDDRQKR
jgi:hypothetical protein